MTNIGLSSEIENRISRLEAGGNASSSVGLVERAAYQVILGLVNHDAETASKFTWVTDMGVAVPSYCFEKSPEVVEYGRYINDFRNAAFYESILVWNEYLSQSWVGSKDLLLECQQTLTEMPILICPASIMTLEDTARALGIESSVINSAFSKVKYWKASEHLEWRSWSDPEHDILTWILRNPSLRDHIATTHHFVHESNHPPIDYYSNHMGWPVSNWLTEGFCEMWAGESEVLSEHACQLLNQFGSLEAINFEAIVQCLHDNSTCTAIKHPKYTLGWAVVYGASSACSKRGNPDEGCGKLLSSLTTFPGAELDQIMQIAHRDGLFVMQDFNNALQNRIRAFS